MKIALVSKNVSQQKLNGRSNALDLGFDWLVFETAEKAEDALETQAVDLLMISESYEESQIDKLYNLKLKKGIPLAGFDADLDANGLNHFAFQCLGPR